MARPSSDAIADAVARADDAVPEALTRQRGHNLPWRKLDHAGSSQRHPQAVRQAAATSCRPACLFLACASWAKAAGRARPGSSPISMWPYGKGPKPQAMSAALETRRHAVYYNSTTGKCVCALLEGDPIRPYTLTSTYTRAYRRNLTGEEVVGCHRLSIEMQMLCICITHMITHRPPPLRKIRTTSLGPTQVIP